MSDALEKATEDLRLLCDLHEGGTPIMMSAAQFVVESGRAILAALREREQAIAAEREACRKIAVDYCISGHASKVAEAIRARGKGAGDA